MKRVFFSEAVQAENNVNLEKLICENTWKYWPRKLGANTGPNRYQHIVQSVYN